MDGTRRNDTQCAKFASFGLKKSEARKPLNFNEFQLREEDLNALARGPEPRVLAATLSRYNLHRVSKPSGSALFIHGAE